MVAMMALILIYGGTAKPEGTESRVSVPFTKHENGMVIQARINGKGPFSFIVDTGAAMTVVSAAAAAEAGLRSEGEEVMLVGVGGQPVRGTVAQVRELSVAGARARRMDVVIYEIPHLRKAKIAGLIGQDFLERFDLSFDNRRKLLTLALPDLAKPRMTGKKPLGLIEQMAQKIFEDPSQSFQSFPEITRRAQEYYNFCASGSPPPAEDLEDFQALLDHQQRRMNQLYQHLLNLPFHDLKPQWNANVQKFLYCWPDYEAYINQALELVTQLKAEEIDWPRAGSGINKITEISTRFGCKPPLETPAFLETGENQR